MELTKAEEALFSTEQQARFAACILDGMEIPEASLEAGYSKPNAGYSVAASSTFQAALHKCRQRHIATVGASIGLKTMIDLAKGEKIPAATRYAAAKFLMGLGGHVEKAGGGEEETPLHEMTTAQLKAFIARVRSDVAAGGEPPVIKVIEGDNAQPGHNPAP